MISMLTCHETRARRFPFDPGDVGIRLAELRDSYLLEQIRSGPISEGVRRVAETCLKLISVWETSQSFRQLFDEVVQSEHNPIPGPPLTAPVVIDWLHHEVEALISILSEYPVEEPLFASQEWFIDRELLIPNSQDLEECKRCAVVCAVRGLFRQSLCLSNQLDYVHRVLSDTVEDDEICKPSGGYFRKSLQHKLKNIGQLAGILATPEFRRDQGLGSKHDALLSLVSSFDKFEGEYYRFLRIILTEPKNTSERDVYWSLLIREVTSFSPGAQIAVPYFVARARFRKVDYPDFWHNLNALASTGPFLRRIGSLGIFNSRSAYFRFENFIYTPEHMKTDFYYGLYFYLFPFYDYTQYLDNRVKALCRFAEMSKALCLYDVRTAERMRIRIEGNVGLVILACFCLFLGSAGLLGGSVLSGLGMVASLPIICFVIYYRTLPVIFGRTFEKGREQLQNLFDHCWLILENRIEADCARAIVPLVEIAFRPIGLSAIAFYRLLN